MAGGWSKTQESEATRRRSLVLRNIVDSTVIIDPRDHWEPAAPISRRRRGELGSLPPKRGW